MIYTKSETIAQEATIWAIPKTQYERTQDQKQGRDFSPFRYEIFTGYLSSPWQEGSVKVATIHVKGEVPEGINLYEKAVDTLEEKMDKIRADAQRQIQEVKKQLDSLKLLAAPTTPTPEGGELV